MSASPELLTLTGATPEAWAEAAAREPLSLLSDHAYCEMGAASTAHLLIARNPSNTKLVGAMARLAAEEMRHFRQVHQLLVEHGGELGPNRSNPYVEGLLRLVRRERESGLLDRLLVAALIERRSLERFELLAEHLPAPIASLYRELGPSEAGHALLFVDLARHSCPGADVDGRLEELAHREGASLRALPFEPRVHSGVVGLAGFDDPLNAATNPADPEACGTPGRES